MDAALTETKVKVDTINENITTRAFGFILYCLLPILILVLLH